MATNETTDQGRPERPQRPASTAPVRAEADPSPQLTSVPLPIAPRTAGGIVRKALQVVVGISLATFLLGWVLPWLTHTPWSVILQELGRLGPGKALLLFGMMMTGLYCYTFTLSASLPGLKHGAALIVNLCGSGVSNSMPGGGAMGVAAQYAIFRSWRFSHRDIGTSLIITSIWNLLVRAILPIIAVIWLLASGTTDLPRAIVLGVLGAVLVAVVMISLAVAILASDKSAHAIGHVLTKVIRPVLRLLKKPDDVDIEAIALDMRSRIIHVIRPGWIRLTFGVLGFLGIYFFLFRETMMAFGIDLPWAQVFACYALSRMLTMVPLTPGGIGVTELASGLMIAFGAQHSAAAAAVILFAIYSHILEIPLGLVAAGAWTLTKKHYAVDQAGGPDSDTDSGPDSGPGDVPETHLPAFH